MDPFSVSTVCVGLLAAVAQLTTQIAQFVSGVREARRDMDSVSRELSSLALCLETLRDDSTKIQYPDGLRQTLVAVLGNCDTVTQQMHTLLEKMSSKNLGRRAQWVATGRDDMNRLRSSLEAYKSALDIALEVTAISIISAVKDDIKDVKAETAAIKEDTNQIPIIKQDTSSLIQEIAFLRLQVTELQQHDTGGGVILQRFLQESTTYAETVIDNLEEEEGPVSARSSTEGLDRVVTRSPREGPDETAARATKPKHSDPVMPIEERRNLPEDISDGREDETSDLGQNTEGSRPPENIPDIYGTEIIGSEASRRQFGTDQQTTRQIRRRLPDRKAMKSAAAARKRLSPREKKSLDDRLTLLIRGKKTLLSRFGPFNPWYGDEVGDAKEIRSVLDAGGRFFGLEIHLKCLQEALHAELYHFRRLEVIELLLSYGALDDCTLPLDHIRIWDLSHSLLQLLLEYWEDPNIPNGVAGTALYQCAARGVTGYVALLLEHGADPNIVNAERYVNLRFHSRFSMPHSSCLNYGSPLNIACYNGHLDTVKVLLEGGAELNRTADWPVGTPAEHLMEGARAAAKRGKTNTEYAKIKKILESAGANVGNWELW